MRGAPAPPCGDHGGLGDPVQLLAPELGSHVGDGLAHAVGELAEDVPGPALALYGLKEENYFYFNC